MDDLCVDDSIQLKHTQAYPPFTCNRWTEPAKQTNEQLNVNNETKKKRR